ncbi:RCC1 domain-containing protein [Thelohanellus kitauei]|uniref:RCC1 domain-containing protein n=1 Tax=Thelohanellus kitauei TaxID=669202 RepID=A0A0C2IQE9_THEKT|nr:RCC1 domain-containing protein [Thelohanellus kitauei]
MHGQLGTGDTEDSNSMKFVKLEDDLKIKQIKGGGSHTLILYGKIVIILENGELYTAGKNDRGQLMRNTKLQHCFNFKKTDFEEKINFVSCGWDNSLLVFGFITCYIRSICGFVRVMHF